MCFENCANSNFCGKRSSMWHKYCSTKAVSVAFDHRDKTRKLARDALHMLLAGSGLAADIDGTVVTVRPLRREDSAVQTLAPVSVPVCVSLSEVAEDETNFQGALAVSPWGGPFSCPPKGRHMKSPRR